MDLNLASIKKLIVSLPSYLFYTTTYSHTFVVYSYCNIDDCSWGKKGLNSDSNDYYY